MQAVAAAVETMVAAEAFAAVVASCNETDPNSACLASLSDAVASGAEIVAARLEIAIEAAELKVAGACMKPSAAGSASVGTEQSDVHL